MIKIGAPLWLRKPPYDTRVIYRWSNPAGIDSLGPQFFAMSSPVGRWTEHPWHIFVKFPSYGLVCLGQFFFSVGCPNFRPRRRDLLLWPWSLGNGCWVDLILNYQRLIHLNPTSLAVVSPMNAPSADSRLGKVLWRWTPGMMRVSLVWIITFCRFRFL